MMHLSHAWLVILLHRPFYRPLAGIPSSQMTGEAQSAQSNRAAWAVKVCQVVHTDSDLKQCDKAAIHVIHLLWIWHRYHDLRFSPPTALQVCFVAGTTHLLSLASARSNSKRQSDSVARVDECLRLLGFMAKSWLAAEQARALLQGLKEEYGFSESNKAAEDLRSSALSSAPRRLDRQTEVPAQMQPSSLPYSGPTQVPAAWSNVRESQGT
jgi:hypothetical protein